MMRRVWHWLWTSSVRRQLIVGVALVHILLMTLFVFDLVHRQREFLTERAKSRVLLQAELLAGSSIQGAMSNDLGGLSEVLAVIGKDNDVSRAMVTDRRGRVLADMRGANVGLFRNDQRTLAVLSSAPQTLVVDQDVRLIEAAAPIVAQGRVIGWAWVARNLGPEQAHLAYVTHAGLIYTVAAILIGTVFAFLLAGRVTRQLRVLLAGTKRMAVNRLDQEVPVTTDNEVGQVTRAFNDAMHRLSEQQESLREDEERWSTTLRSIGDAVISTCAQGKVVFMNEVAEKLTGWPLSEAQGRDLIEVFSIVNEVTRTKPESPVSKVFRMGQVVGLANHTALISRNGLEFPIEDSAAPIRDNEGKLTGVVLVFHDVIEKRRAERAVRDSERLAMTGRMASTLAHEIHNPLDTVGGLLYLIDRNPNVPDAVRQQAALASDEVTRITQLTRHMLSFQREAKAPLPIKIGEILDNVLALYGRKIESAGIQVEKQVDFGEEFIGLPGEMRQVFANLVGNAIEAIGKHGKIRLHAYPGREWRQGRRGLRVTVADNGPGIPSEVRDKIFDPFFTTKGEAGTGLGLWIVSGIIENNDGLLRHRTVTRDGRSGTCFSVFLPFSA